nr:GAF domain-containing protein [Lachnospiraceae bacterium]
MEYELWAKSLRELVREVPWPVANMANAAAFIFETVGRLNWAGFYRTERTAAGEPLLVLGPFQGRPACIEIPWGRGVCGTAAAQDRPLKVDDVHEFPGHIACDAASASEVVVPLHNAAGEVIGVLDLDSPEPARFTDEDFAGLIDFARVIEEWI